MPNNSIEGHDPAIPFHSWLHSLRTHRDAHPHKPALVDLARDVSITWGQLYDCANRLAHYLADRGIGRGDRVALLSGECMEKLIIHAGLWRAGAVVMPLNVEMNQAYMAEYLVMLEPKLTLWQKDLDGAALTAGVGGEITRFGDWRADRVGDPDGDEFFARLAALPGDPELPGEVDPFEMAIIFCTSGTTARPKLIVCHHMCEWLFGLSTIDYIGLSGADRTLEYRSFGWASALGLSLVPWLQTGCTLHVAPQFSHTNFFDWIKRHQITFAPGIPTVLNMLLDKPTGVSHADIPSLRFMTCSTAPLSPERWRQFEETYGITLLQGYGSSEAGWVCANRPSRIKMGTVGPPAKHQEFEIVDEKGKPCPPGIEGEVTVGGPQTYMVTITPEGVWEYPPERIRHGDLAVIDEEGFVTVTGRVKDLIIRGGFNISPLEIDHLLAQIGDLSEGAAIGVPDPIYGEEVVCFVVAKEGRRPSADDIKAHCAKTLPEFKMPKQVFFIDAIPKNDRGKVRRDALRDLWLEENG